MPVAIDEKAIQDIARINPNALNPDGTLKSLLEQYGEVRMRHEADPFYRARGPYVLAPDVDFLGIPQAAGRTLTISDRDLRSIATNHGAPVEVLSRLPEELGQCILGCGWGSEEQLAFVLDVKPEGENEAITVLYAELRDGSMEVSSIQSAGGRFRDRLFENMGDAIDQGREFYFGQKAGAWLEAQGNMPGTSGIPSETIKRLQNAFHACDLPQASEKGLASTRPLDLGGSIIPDAGFDEKIAAAMRLDIPHEFSEIEHSFPSKADEKFYIELRMDRLTAREAESRFPEVFSASGLLDEAEPVFHREWSGCSEFLTCAEAASGHEWQATLITSDGSTTFTAFGPAEAYEYLCDMEAEHFENAVRAQRGLFAEDVAHLKQLTPLQRAANLDAGLYGIRTEMLREAVADMPAGKFAGKAEQPTLKPHVPGKSPGAATAAGSRSFESSLEAAQMSARAQAARMGLANPTRQQGAR